eukprot:Skav234495  [mRNA]  locus=scaffold3731:176439:180656:+ [translate_table: standard]
MAVSINVSLTSVSASEVSLRYFFRQSSTTGETRELTLEPVIPLCQPLKVGKYGRQKWHGTIGSDSLESATPGRVQGNGGEEKVSELFGKDFDAEMKPSLAKPHFFKAEDVTRVTKAGEEGKKCLVKEESTREKMIQNAHIRRIRSRTVVMVDKWAAFKPLDCDLNLEANSSRNFSLRQRRAGNAGRP